LDRASVCRAFTATSSDMQETAMKTLLATTGLVLLTLGGVMAHQAAKTGGPDAAVAKALIDLEHQWQTASKANDGEALGKLLADGFVSLDTDGTTRTKAEVVALAKKSKLTTNEISDLKVVAVHGDTAVVTGLWTGKGVDGSGKTIDTKERWVDSWAKIGGKWQCISSASATTK
jgi:ketosteroid isomerase-like protein